MRYEKVTMGMETGSGTLFGGYAVYSCGVMGREGCAGGADVQSSFEQAGIDHDACDDEKAEAQRSRIRRPVVEQQQISSRRRPDGKDYG